MNKLFTKIGVAMVGLAMAVGVGVAVESKNSAIKTNAAAAAHGYSLVELFDGAKVLIVTTDPDAATSKKYYVPANKAYTSSAISNSSTYSSIDSIDESHLWTVEKTTVSNKEAWIFSTTISNATYYLTVSGTGTGDKTRINTITTYCAWYVASVSGYHHSIQNATTSNYFGVYSTGSDWRVYGSATQANFKGSGREFEFYAPKYTVSYDANSGSGSITDSNSPYVMGTTVTTKNNSFTRSGYSFTGWNTKANGSGTSYDEGDTFKISADTTLYAQWEISGTSYSVTGALTGCTLDNTANVVEGDTYSATITPSANHHLPASITVEMGDKELDIDKEEYSYNLTTGAISVPNVRGDLTITVVCESDPTYSITYSKGEHGTGSDYAVSDLYAGKHYLSTFAATGLKASAGYKFDHWEIGGVSYAEGAEITISNANVSVTAVYSVLANKISISPSNFVNTGYADNNGAHTIGDYEITTNAVMRGTGDHSEEMQFQKTNGAMYNTTIGFSYGIKMIKTVGTGSYTVTFDTTLKSVAGSVASKTAVTNLGSNVTYYIPDTTDDCVYFHIQKDGTGTAYFTSIEVYSSESAAEEFSKMYLAAYTCNNAGTTAPTATTGYTVANISTLYSRLDDATKALLINAADNHTASYGTDKVKEFGQRYYLTVYNHGSDYDFMGRIAAGKITPKASAAMIGFDSGEQSDITFVIITISVVSLIAVGGFFFLRKKKEQ